MTEPRLTVEDAFAPPGEPWRPVSARLATARRLTMLLVLVPLVAVITVVLVLGGADPLLVALPLVVGLVSGSWLWWLIGRRVRSFGYAERDDDLLVTSGIMFRRLVVVPYGRMQLVDITAGPIDRSLGLATVQLHTAAASTNATIPGLPPEEASGLRDRLAARGEQRSAGL
ncbi:MAG: PH domain-containing protein [Candidatus Nanopelagicales bacterium]|jgi:membrane protein YdbS with pleckstrin-like domain|nr:PH domain-containing protein [Candidatus Nanopelagicales bacterium]